VPPVSGHLMPLNTVLTCLLAAGVQGRCAARASSLHWCTLRCRRTPRGSRTARAAGAGARAAAKALAPALTLAKSARASNTPVDSTRWSARAGGLGGLVLHAWPH
jgi:hypothetical protein